MIQIDFNSLLAGKDVFFKKIKYKLPLWILCFSESRKEKQEMDVTPLLCVLYDSNKDI